MKKWEEIEINDAINSIKNGLKYSEIAALLNRTTKSVRLKLNKLGYHQNKDDFHEDVTCECCGKKINGLISDNRKYCSQSCAAKINGSKYPKRVGNDRIIECINCGKALKNKYSKYCSFECNIEHKKHILYERVKNVDENLSHRQYKKYLISMYGEKCMICGWCEKNERSGKIPIELEHIDGNSKNNSLENLKLLCPNCHSLTPTYKALNVGNGRHSRMERYKNGKSF
jgi:hypothetical protein